nr:PadR family transcriptional regulator [Streptomyces californicus]
MSLPHAILTALLEKPSSGLELTRRFDRSIGYFWSSTHQQIYRELGKLEQAGRIRALPPAAPARGQKKEYEVLPAGREELALSLIHLALHEGQLAEYREIERRDFTPAPATDEGRLRYLVLRGGIDLETFWIGWLTRAIADLDG